MCRSPGGMEHCSKRPGRHLCQTISGEGEGPAVAAAATALHPCIASLMHGMHVNNSRWLQCVHIPRASALTLHSALPHSTFPKQTYLPSTDTPTPLFAHSPFPCDLPSSSMQLADLLNSTTMQPGQQQQQEQAWRDAPLVSAVNTPSPDTTPPTRSHSPKVGSGGLGVTAAAGLHLPVTALLGTPVAGAHVTGPVAASEGSPARKRHGSSSGAGPHVSPECASRQQVAPSAWAEGSVDGVQSRGRRGSSRTGLGMLSLAPLLQAANWSVGEDAAGAHGATHAAGLAAARGSSRMRPL